MALSARYILWRRQLLSGNRRLNIFLSPIVPLRKDTLWSVHALCLVSPPHLPSSTSHAVSVITFDH